MMKLTVIFMSCSLLVLPRTLTAQSSQISLNDDSIKCIAGSWVRECCKTWNVNKKSISGDAVSGGRSCNCVTFDIRNWSEFTAMATIPDDRETCGGSVSIEIDGVVFQTIIQKHHQDATPIAISLTGKRTLTIRWIGNTVFLINPRLSKDRLPESANGQSIAGDKKMPEAINDALLARFAISSSSFDKLANSLREHCSANLALKNKVKKNRRVAIVHFDISGASAKSISNSVVESLHTAMIKAGFNAVAKKQLDKVLNKLNISDSCAVDPATAQKIGMLSGCDIVIIGSISDKGVIIVNVCMIDVESGKSLATERVSF